MSTLLSYSSALMDIGSTVDQWKTVFKSKLTSWQILNETDGTLDIIPPTTSPVGNTLGKDVVRVHFAETFIGFQGWTLPATLPSAHTLTLTVLDSADPYVISAGNTAISMPKEATEELSAAKLVTLLTDSEDYTLRAYTWTAANNVITGVAKNTYTAFRFSISENLGKTSTKHPALTTATEVARVPIDLNGFIYFLSVHERALVLAIRTVEGYYGPIYAQYGNNADIKAQTPEGCIPVELVVGTSAYGTYNNNIKGRTTHTHMMGKSVENSPVSSDYSFYGKLGDVVRSGNIFTGNRTTGKLTFEDFSTVSWYITDKVNFTYDAGQFNFDNSSSASGGYDNSPSLLGIPVNQMNVQNTIRNLLSDEHIVSNGMQQWYISGVIDEFEGIRFRPNIGLDDVYTFLTNGTDESLNYTKIKTIKSSIPAEILGTDTVTEIVLDDASKFSNIGTVIIGAEAFEYTGKTGNTLTGVTRAKYGTAKETHAVLSDCYQAQWFVKINSGALLAGYVKPVL